jgi:hypothetical protein
MKAVRSVLVPSKGSVSVVNNVYRLLLVSSPFDAYRRQVIMPQVELDSSL